MNSQHIRAVATHTWHGYLMARHQTFLVYRAEDPKEFWQNIAVYCIFGLGSLGLYVYTLN